MKSISLQLTRVNSPKVFRPFFLAVALIGLGSQTQCEKVGALYSKLRPQSKAAVSLPANSASTVSGEGNLAIVQDGQAKSFQKVAAHLELGGQSFSFNERLGNSPSLSLILDTMLSSLTEVERKNLPKDFSVTEMFNHLGFSQIQASGSSARIRGDGSYHTRTFAYMPEGRKGLLKLTGGTSKKLLTLESAPQDIDLAVEFSLQLKELFETVVPYLEKILPPAEAKKLRKQLNAPILPFATQSTQKMLEQVDVRVAYFSRIDERRKPISPAPGVNMPATQDAIIVENIDWLVKEIRAQMMPMLKSPMSPVEIKDEGDVLEATFKNNIGPGMLDIKPSLRFDTKLNRLIIATSPELLKEVIEASGRFETRSDFAKIWNGLSHEGSAAAFCSERYQKVVAEGLKNSFSKPSTRADSERFVENLKAMFKSNGSTSTAFVMTNLEDGVLLTANCGVPAVEMDMLASIAGVGIISAIVIPNIGSINESARMASAKRSAMTAPSSETLGAGVLEHLKEYAAQNKGAYPKTLAELVDAGIATDPNEVKVVDPQTGELKDWLYNARLNAQSAGNELALASPFVQSGGTRLVVFHDGTLQVITEKELEQIILKQQPSPKASQSMR